MQVEVEVRGKQIPGLTAFLHMVWAINVFMTCSGESEDAVVVSPIADLRERWDCCSGKL